MMAELADAAHVLVVTFPGQGHVNPFLRFAKLLTSKGLFVTFVVTEQTGDRLLRSNPGQFGGRFLQIDFISDGLHFDADRTTNLDFYMDHLNPAGAKSFELLIRKHAANGKPVTVVVSNPFIPWTGRIAASLGIRCAVLWPQPAYVFIPYHQFIEAAPITSLPPPHEASSTIELPGLPVKLNYDDLPTFLLPTNPYKCLTDAFKKQFSLLGEVSWILANTFDELEHEALREFGIKPIGPLVPTDLLGHVSGDLWTAADCIGWLDSQPKLSVVYVSFGSVVSLSETQLEEIAYGLELTGKPFLWVVKPPEGDSSSKLPAGFEERIKGRGMVVQWCPQTRVLSHPSVACFVSHCGWNSTLESMAAGVPVVAFPEFGDQTLTAKFLSEVYGVGVRLVKGEDGVVGREEVAEKVRVAMEGVKSVVLRENAAKWQKAAREAVVNGGSSDRNIQEFVDEVRKISANHKNVDSLA